MNIITLHIIKLFSLTFILMGIAVSVYGQNCMDSLYTHKANLGDKSVEFHYCIEKTENISFKNGRYEISDKAKNNLKIKVFIKHKMQGDSIIYFKNEWLDKSLFSIDNASGKRIKSNGKSFKLILNKSSKHKKNIDFILPFGIGKDASSIKEHSEPLKFAFAFEGGEETPPQKAGITEPDSDSIEAAKVTSGETLAKGDDKIRVDEIVPEKPKKNLEVTLTPTEKVIINPIKPKDSIDKPDIPTVLPTIQKAPSGNKEKQKERTLWKKTEEEDTIEAYENFIKKFPKSSWRIKKAKAKIEEITQAKTTEIKLDYITENEVILANVFAPIVVDNGKLNFNYKIEKVPDEKYQKKLIISDIKNQQNVVIEIEDTLKPNGVNKRTIRLGKHLEVLSVLIDKIFTDTIFAGTYIKEIRFKNGVPPYKITFLSTPLMPYTLKPDDYKITHKDKDSLIAVWQPKADDALFKQLYDTIRFTITDSELNKPYENDDWKLIRPSQKDNNDLITLVLKVGLIPFGLVFLYVVLQPNRNRRRIRKLDKERSENWIVFDKNNEAKKETILNNKVDIEEGGNQYEIQPSNCNIRILGIQKASSKAIEYENEKKLEKVLLKDLLYTFEMNKLWHNSSVSKIYFNRNCADALEDFIWQQTLSPLNEGNAEIPEIGGIIMGKAYRQKNTRIYKIHAKQFVPINPEYHDVYRFEFSRESIAKDLGDIQDEHPDLILVGWFHTHPGHGLFLSKPDLRIHDSFFKESYQFAMEIDTLTEKYDTAFFTRMKNNKVNNRKDLKEHTEWFSWRKTTRNDR